MTHAQGRTSVWTIREINTPDLAHLLTVLHDSHFTGRLMLHISQGSLISAETCERMTVDNLSSEGVSADAILAVTDR